mmetsp:Transcript_26203/g.84306  ORF Transcript_26203/g.84306 Transcript_26203/m.84306 type:complete len:230 (+) Transcript_26203:345-1034(+)
MLDAQNTRTGAPSGELRRRCDDMRATAPGYCMWEPHRNTFCRMSNAPSGVQDRSALSTQLSTPISSTPASVGSNSASGTRKRSQPTRRVKSSSDSGSDLVNEQDMSLKLACEASPTTALWCAAAAVPTAAAAAAASTYDWPLSKQCNRCCARSSSSAMRRSCSSRSSGLACRSRYTSQSESRAPKSSASSSSAVIASSVLASALEPMPSDAMRRMRCFDAAVRLPAVAW